MTPCRRIAFVLALAAGCGSVHGTAPPDAPSGDDAPGTTLVTLTVLSTTGDGAADTGAIAVFVDQGGTLIADGLVDGAGHAQAMMPDGGAVTVIRVNDVSATERDVAMTTIESVKPGDQLVVGTTASPRAFPGAPTAMTASFTSFAANYSYSFYTGCGQTGGSVSGTTGSAQLSMYDACHGATFDLVSVATSADGTDVRYVYQPGLAYAPGATITVPNTWMTMDNFTVTLANVPVNFDSIQLTRSALLGESPVPTSGGVMSPPAGIVSVTAPMVPGVGARSEVELALHKTNASGFQILDVRTASIAATQGIDLSQQPLPFIAGTPTETTTSVSWDSLDADSPVDLRLITWAGHWADGGRTDFINWTIEDGGDLSLSESGPGIALPSLPAAYSQFDPSKASGVVLGHGAVEYIDYDRLQGYDEARPFGPNLDAPIDDLGLFIDMPLVRRLSRSPLSF